MFRLTICPNKDDVHANCYELPIDIPTPCVFQFNNGEIVKITWHKNDKDKEDTYVVKVVKISNDDVDNFIDMRIDKAMIYLLTIPEKINGINYEK